MPRHKFQVAGPGRPVGSKNKLSKDLAESFIKTFEEIGGSEKLKQWAEEPKNQGEFYRLIAKLFPKPEPTVNVGVGIQGSKMDLAQMLTQARKRIQAIRDQESEGSKTP